jgi:L-fuculose-phosphate aldolase
MMQRDDRRVAALELVAAGAELARAGLILPGEGNLSSRLDGESCLITPTGADKGRLRAVDLLALALRLDGSPVPAGASSESGLHVAIYRRYAEVGAVLHAHPPRVQALAGRGLAPKCGLLVEGTELLGTAAWVEPCPPGSRVLEEAVVTVLERASACVLAGHGALVVGRTMREGLRRLLLLERLAELTLDRGR